jgi:hypothetical protein
MTFLTGFSLVSVLAEDAALPPRRIALAVLATVLGAVVYALAPRPPAAEVRRALLGTSAEPPARRPFS